MASATTQIVPMSARKYMTVPVEEIRVLNSRNRDKTQFDQNIRSIGAVGLLKPIVVNGRPHAKHGYYELICGEGRYLAHKALKKEYIAAEVLDCDRKTALLFSLVENIARVPPRSIAFAYEVKRMRDGGLPMQRISAIVGRPEADVTEYICLVEAGEERLIAGVEQGMFPISFALKVARSSTTAIQQVLMDAFDSGLINSGNVIHVRNMIERRVNTGKQSSKERGVPKQTTYTLCELKGDIAKATERLEGYVRESETKENRLLNLLDGLATLEKDAALMALLQAEGVSERPALLGQYNA